MTPVEGFDPSDWMLSTVSRVIKTVSMCEHAGGDDLMIIVTRENRAACWDCWRAQPPRIKSDVCYKCGQSGTGHHLMVPTPSLAFLVDLCPSCTEDETG